MPLQVRCFDPLHATRVGQPGFTDLLGTRPSSSNADVVVPGLFCGACGKIFHDQKIVDTEATRQSRKQAVVRFLAANPSLTRADVRNLFGAALGVDPDDI
jgi:hypothetical protein